MKKMAYASSWIYSLYSSFRAYETYYHYDYPSVGSEFHKIIDNCKPDEILNDCDLPVKNNNFTIYLYS